MPDLQKSRAVDSERIRFAHKLSAQIVVKYGPEFLPVFERLEREVAKLDGQDAALERALAICRNEKDD